MKGVACPDEISRSFMLVISGIVKRVPNILPYFPFLSNVVLRMILLLDDLRVDLRKDFAASPNFFSTRFLVLDSGVLIPSSRIRSFRNVLKPTSITTSQVSPSTTYTTSAE